MAAAQPYNDLVVRAQTTIQPIAPQMARQVELYMRRVTAAFVDGPPLVKGCFEGIFNKSRTTCGHVAGHRTFGVQYAIVREALLSMGTDYTTFIAAADERASEIATSQVADFKKRLEDGGTKSEENPYELSLMDIFLACAFIQPTPSPHANCKCTQSSKCVWT